MRATAGIAAIVIAAATLLVALGTSEASTADAEGTLLVADLRGDALLVLDPESLAVRQRIGLPGGAHELLPLPDGRVLVSIEQQGQLVVVDLADGRIDVIGVGGTPHGLALAGDEVLVTDRAINAVRRFDLATWFEQSSVPTGRWPHAVGVTPDGEVAVAVADGGALEIGGRVHALGRTTETLDIRADGAIAAAAATDGVVAVYWTDELAGRWDVGGRPVRVRFSEDGARLAVALSAAGAVAIIDETGMRTVQVTGVPDGLQFSQDGSRLFVSDVFGGAVSVVEIEQGGGGEVRSVAGVGESTGAMLLIP